ncbi:MAG: family 20 glycosylhydrolase [Proteiniphilum sp.]|nr:family 20 glycosylhydrolase [Proteiniphilum sp.]
MKTRNDVKERFCGKNRLNIQLIYVSISGHTCHSKMKKTILSFFLLIMVTATYSQDEAEPLFQIKGFSIGAPSPDQVDRFVTFINEELTPRGVNTLLLLVDYNYEYQSYPQLRTPDALSKAQVKKIVKACSDNKIRIIPQINLLGHQSWSNNLNPLLTHFPEFDETPHVKMPEKYVCPNDDDLYCKSYCPLHPDVHKVIFALVDEICDVFETDAFHAGMDEVFYLGDDKCPRCSGVDKAELFAGEVRKIHDHLAEKNRELWIWGDRLIEGKRTGMGIWEASYNFTWRAVDLIPKDVVICDWHYERPDQTPVYFAMKGFRVITCPWRTPSTALIQTEDMARWRKYATKKMKPRYYGMMQTTWTSPQRFMDGFYGIKTASAHPSTEKQDSINNPWNTFRQMYKRMSQLENEMK